MKISLFQGILMGVFIIGALIGLFVFATYTSKNSSNAIGPVLIWGTLPKEDMNTVLSSVARTEIGLKNITYIEKDPATIVTDLSAAIATGAAPDLVLDSQENLHALAKFIAPISLATLPMRTFQNTFVEEGSIFLAPGEAGYYGVPFLVDPLVLFSNRSILSSSGIAKPPSTWEALVGLVPSVARLTPTRQITRGLIALGTYNNVHSARGILSTLFLQTGVQLSSSFSNNGALIANLGGAVPASGAAPPGRAVLGFYTQFADPSKVSYTWNVSLPDSERMFLTGDLALYIGYASRARFLQQANPNLNFDIAPLPQPATARVKSVYGLMYALMIPRGAKNATGAYAAAVLLTSAAEQAAAATHTGLAPAVLSQLAVVPADPIAAVTYAEALYSKGWLSPSAASTDAVFSSMINNVITGRSTLNAALISAERSLSALLQQ
ncbi:MAG: extracellular solute-binding protein [bacterium]|nr:extracellular solute-binding protein [bacterium]